MQIAKWGNSLAVRLPAEAVKALGLKAGDEMEVRVANDHQLELVRKRSREEILNDIFERVKGTMPADYKFDREEANARR